MENQIDDSLRNGTKEMEFSTKLNYYILVSIELYNLNIEFYSIEYMRKNICIFNEWSVQFFTELLEEMSEISIKSEDHYVCKKQIEGIAYYKLHINRVTIIENEDDHYFENEFILRHYMISTILNYHSICDEFYVIFDYFYSAKQLAKIVPKFAAFKDSYLVELLEKMSEPDNFAKVKYLDKRVHKRIPYYRLSSQTRADIQKEKRINDSYKIKTYDDGHSIKKYWEYISHNYLISGLILLLLFFRIRHFK